jgi:hypothetical protein
MSVGLPTCCTTALHHHDAVGQRHRLDLVVGHVDGGHRQLMAEVLDLRPGRDAQLGVEVRQRLVHQEHVGLAHDGAGQRHALPLAARQLGGLAVQEIVQFHHGRGAAHLLVMGRRVDTAHLQRKADVLVDVHVRVERVGLEHHRHVPVLGIEMGHHLAADQDLAPRSDPRARRSCASSWSCRSPRGQEAPGTRGRRWSGRNHRRRRTTPSACTHCAERFPPWRNPPCQISPRIFCIRLQKA